MPASRDFQSVFNDGFAVTAGDRKHALKVFTAMPACQSLQSPQWIGNHNHRPRRIKRRAGQLILRDQCRSCAIVERVSKKAVAVGLLAFQRDKERAGSGAARVSADAVYC